MENEATGIKPWQWIVTIIIVLVVIIFGFMLFKGGDNGSQGENTNNTNTATNNTVGVNRIMVGDQYPGNVVYITSVQLSAPGWVAIHKDESGKPGKIIGYTYFEKGINPGRVVLTENTVSGMSYYAMLHSDNGDKNFNEAVDLPLKDAQGSIIMKMFKVTEDVTEFKG